MYNNMYIYIFMYACMYIYLSEDADQRVARSRLLLLQLNIGVHLQNQRTN
jgi:hypothetical protein